MSDTNEPVVDTNEPPVADTGTDNAAQPEGAEPSVDTGLADRIAEAEALIERLSGGGQQPPTQPQARQAPQGHQQTKDDGFVVPWSEKEQQAALEEAPSMAPVLEAMVAQLEAYHNRIAELTGKYGTLEQSGGYMQQFVKQAQEAASRQWFDGWIDRNSKEKGWGDFFGSSATRSPAHQKLADSTRQVAEKFYTALSDMNPPKDRASNEKLMEKASLLAVSHILGDKADVSGVRAQIKKKSQTQTNAPGYGKTGGGPQAKDPRAAAVNTFSEGLASLKRDNA